VVDGLAARRSQANPDLLAAMNALGAVAFELGDLTPACETLERALAIADAEPGHDEAISLAIKENLATVVEAQRSFTRSVQLREQTLALRRGALGLEHPLTSRNAWNLALSLAELGRSRESVEVAAEHLGWLLNANPGGLTAEQRDIREKLIVATRQDVASA
jgi:tetratricopeptide (TPR) repeat protein